MPARILVLALVATSVAKAQAAGPWEVGAAAGFASNPGIKGPTGGEAVVRPVNNPLAGIATVDVARQPSVSLAASKDVLPLVQAVIRPPAFLGHCRVIGGRWSFFAPAAPLHF